MIRIFLVLAVSIFFLNTNGQSSFREDQLAYARVRQAYDEKWTGIDSLLNIHGIDREKIEMYIRAFKSGKEFEVWGRNKGDDQFTLLLKKPICRTSGELGPKREQGDRQIPEGYYHISAQNPWSSFHLSVCINYPNPSDRILGIQGNLGDNICIHGSCVTIGCIPLTDDVIKLVYILYVEARNNGQQRIPVTIFPERMTQDNYTALLRDFPDDNDKTGLWQDLKDGYDYFEAHKDLPDITFLENGRHLVGE